MGKSSSPPPAPDPYKVAGAQTQQNKDAALYNAMINRMDTYTPYGSQTYSINGYDPATGAPRYEQNIELDPAQQELLEQQNAQNLQMGNIAGGMMDSIQDAYGGPMDVSGVPGVNHGYESRFPTASLDGSNLPELKTDPTAMRQQAQDALYSRNTEYMDPQFERGEQALRTRLANQGVVEGSEAYQNAMSDFNQSKETAYRQARNDSIAGAGAEMSRDYGISADARRQMYGEALSGGQFENQAIAQGNAESARQAEFGNRSRAQQLEEMFALRGQPLNEFTALRGNTQVQAPNFSGPAQVGSAPADIAGAIQNQYQGQIDAYNAKQQSRNAITGAIGSLGAAALSNPALFALSDEREKENIEPIGELNDGTGLYSYNYKGHDTRQVGVMAQEVEKTHPDAVKEFDGRKHVSYARILASQVEAA